MKVSAFLVVLCFTALVSCTIPLDDFAVPQHFVHHTHDINNNAVPEYSETVAGGDLFYARRISSYKNPQHQVTDATLGSGSTTVFGDNWTAGDYIAYEYIYSPNVNFALTGFPPLPQDFVPGSNPFPAGFRDLSSINGFVMDYTPSPAFPQGWGWSIRIIISDTQGGIINTGFNFESTDRHVEITTNGLFSNRIDSSKVNYFAIQFLNSDFTVTNLGFIPACQAPTNVNAAAAAQIPFVLDTPASFPVATCGNCAPADFTGGFNGVQRDNVFWFSVSQQSAAYTATFSSQSFSGIDDAYLWVFSAQGSVLASVDNLSSDVFSATVIVDEAPIFVAFGAACSLESFALDVSFSAVIADLSVQLGEVEENLSSLINAGFTEVETQISGVVGQLTSSTTDIIGAVGQAKSDLQGFVGTETDQIDGEIAGVVTAVENARQTLSDHIDGKFTDLDGTLNTKFGTVGSTLDSIIDQIGDQCGSSSDGVTALSAYLNAQWTNWRNTQIIEKLVTGALVPAHFQTPASQGGALEDVFTFVSNTFNTKKSLADAGKTTPSSSSCKSGADGAYCTFFYRFPNGTGSAQSNYQSAITAYNSWVQQARYAKAFQSLATAYNALFMGQV